MGERVPKVSVIIPTYKRPHYLREALESLANQTFKDFEVLVVDDGTPGNENQELCNNYPNVSYHKIENSGSPIVPRNIGLRAAKGSYIAFLDDDDLWLDDKLQRQVEILDKHSDYGLVHAYCLIIDEHGKETGDITGQLHAAKKHGYVFDKMVGNFTVMLSSPLFRRELIGRAGFFNEDMPAAGEDVEFFIRLAFITKFWFINEPLVKYRVHSSGISNHNFNYVYLPWYLFKVVSGFYKRGMLERSRFVPLRNKLVRNQINAAANWQGFGIALGKCFSISSVFFVMRGVPRRLISKTVELLGLRALFSR